MDQEFTPCRDCSSVSRPPRPGSRRPPDLCARCWKRVKQRQSERTPEQQERHRKRAREYMRARRQRLREEGAPPIATCRECGSLSGPPKAGSARPADVCTNCWPGLRDRDPDYRAREQARQRERYASDPAYRERKKASSRASGRRSRQARTAEQRERSRAYMREFMRQQLDSPGGERRAGKNHVADLQAAGTLTRAFCACGWRSRALRLPEAALAAAREHFDREGVAGRILGQSRSARQQRELRVQGRCVTCGQPSEAETVLCRACREKQRARERERGSELVASGMCRRNCGRPAEPGRTRCEDCLEEARRSTAARRERRLREEAEARIQGRARGTARD